MLITGLELSLLLLIALSTTICFIIYFNKLIAFTIRITKNRQPADQCGDLLMTTFYLAFIGYLIFIYNFKIVQNPLFTNQNQTNQLIFKISSQLAIAISIYPITHCFLNFKALIPVKQYYCSGSTRFALAKTPFTYRKLKSQKDCQFWNSQPVLIQHFKKHQHTYFQINDYRTQHSLLTTLRIDFIDRILINLKNLTHLDVKINYYNDLKSELDFSYQNYHYKGNLDQHKMIDYYQTEQFHHLFNNQLKPIHNLLKNQIQADDHFVIHNQTLSYYRNNQLIKTYDIII